MPRTLESRSVILREVKLWMSEFPGDKSYKFFTHLVFSCTKGLCILRGLNLFPGHF